MAITSAVCTSFKLEMLSAGHCFSPTVSPTASASSGSTALTSVSSIAGISLGMSVSAANIPSTAVIAAIGSTSLTLSQPTTGTITAATINITGDQFYMALFKSTVVGNYDASTTNYNQLVANGDELLGTGYTTGGVPLTLTAPASGGTTAFAEFASPSWSSSTFNTAGFMIYNATSRIANTSGRCVLVYAFPSVQSVVGSTFTIVMPSNDASNALVRIQ